MSKLTRLIEKIFVVFSLIVFSGVITTLLNENNELTSGQSENDPISRILLFGIQIITVILIVGWRKKIIPILFKGNFILWALVGIILASALWSDTPAATLGSSNNILRVTLFGIYFSARFSLKEQLRLLAWALGIGALLSLIVAIVLPSYGVMGAGSIQTQQGTAHTGAWQGIYGHKNVLGRYMSLGALVFLLLAKSSRKYRWLAWAGLCLCVSLLLLSTSKTALIVLLAITALMPLFRTLQWNYTLAVPFFITVILVAASVATFLLENAEAILGTFGRDTTLTGRTLLWATVLYKIWQRPWLGYGYGGFWLGWEGESADVWRIVRWEVPHAHNGFLDLWLNVGLLGLAVFVLSFISAFFRSIALLRQSKNKDILCFWPLAYLTFLLLVNLTESSLMRMSIIWMLYVSVTFTIHNKSNNLTALNTLEKQQVKRTAMYER